jgi:HD-GYP domain-containing protein (c-di-GMP phosphodiesterase class II)
VEARIVACCDAFNAMTTDRPYRAALSLDVALGELNANRGTQFDPRVVDCLLALHRPSPVTAVAV